MAKRRFLLNITGAVHPNLLLTLPYQAVMPYPCGTAKPCESRCRNRLSEWPDCY
jgi:hypothetical protein